MWSDFNAANRSAMLRSEVISWPVTLAIMVLAFGSLVAAGLPLMLTMVGLIAAAGSLYLGTLILPISIWAMNFALMFALALGHRLRAVHRLSLPWGVLRLAPVPVEATAQTMDTAGKAVLFSGLTVLISLTAVMLVPSPAFRSMSLGIMLAVLFVLAATLTLLPAVLARLGPRVDRLSLSWVHSGEHRSARFAAWGERLWRRRPRLRCDRPRRPDSARDSGHAAAHRDALDQGRSRRRLLAAWLRPGPGGVRAGSDRPPADRGPAREARPRSGRRKATPESPPPSRRRPATGWRW